MNKHRPHILGFVGCLTFALSLHFVRTEVSHVVTVRQETLPLLAELPVLERRREVLKEQLELTELQAALRVGSPDEQVRAFVLPSDSPVERFIAGLNVAITTWQQNGMAGEVTAIERHSETSTDGGLARVPITFSITVNDQGAERLREFLSLIGRLTVSDVLRPHELDSLFERIETDNPTGIVPLEQFLSTGLLEYAQDAKAYESSLRHAIPQPLFGALLDQLLERSDLKHVRALFGDTLGKELRTQGLWPLPLVTLQELSLRPGRAAGWWSATVTAVLYRRIEA